MTDYCVYKRLTTDLLDVNVISLCVNGPKIKETEEVANISEFSQCCSSYTKNGQTVKRTTETMTQVNTPIPSPQPQTPVTPIQLYSRPYATY